MSTFKVGDLIKPTGVGDERALRTETQLTGSNVLIKEKSESVTITPGSNYDLLEDNIDLFNSTIRGHGRFSQGISSDEIVIEVFYRSEGSFRGRRDSEPDEIKTADGRFSFSMLNTGVKVRRISIRNNRETDIELLGFSLVGGN